MSALRPLESLITAYLDGQLSAAEEQLLRQRLKEDAEARKLFLSLVDVHATLLGDKLLAAQMTAGELPDTKKLLAAKTIAFPGEAQKPARWPMWVGIAAVLALLLTGVMFYRQTQRTPSAEIVRMAGATFAGTDTTFAEGQTLRRERCVLERGSLELRTAKGVTLVIEAPAEFHFESAQRMQLVRGRLSADVPPTGKGFTVITPSGEVVDLGTRFGVDVADKNTAEVHVFKGEVIAQAGQAAKKQSLKEDQALTLNAGMATPRLLRNAAFIRADEVELLAAGLRAGQQARWTQSLAELSHDPALVSLLDLKQEMKGVYRPAQGRWPGGRAVEFTQPGDYLAIDFQGETEELTLAAWVRLDRVPRAINSLLHTDGWGKPGQPHWMVAEDQRMRFAIYDVRNAVPGTTMYPESSRKVTAATGRWTHLATVYRAQEKTVRFYIDGEFDNEVLVAKGIPVVLGPARVGNWNRQDRILSGRMDELVVLRRALDDAAMKKLFEAGNPYQ